MDQDFEVFFFQNLFRQSLFLYYQMLLMDFFLVELQIKLYSDWVRVISLFLKI